MSETIPQIGKLGVSIRGTGVLLPPPVPTEAVATSLFLLVVIVSEGTGMNYPFLPEGKLRVGIRGTGVLLPPPVP